MIKFVCLFVPVFTFLLLATLSCYYDVNPVVALSRPNGVVPSIDRHISRDYFFALTGNFPCKYNNQFMLAGERTGVNGKS